MNYPPDSPYRRLAKALDALPNRFPPAADESDLRLLAYLFTEEEADLAADLEPALTTPDEIAARTGRDPRQTADHLKEMRRKGLIAFGKTAAGRPGFGLMPFAVGFYENQGNTIDAEFAQRFEDYFHQAFGEGLRVQPPLHRVIPIGEAVRNDLAVQPFESASALVDRMQSWAVTDCICRKQKALIGQDCGHPLDVCMVLSDQPGVFTSGGGLRALTQDEAHAVLHRCAELGLVHCVSNNQRDTWYICNCCTCSCGVLRGMAELGIASVVAKSGFVCQVNEELCATCEDCLPFCQFGALSVDGMAAVNAMRCAGCGVCVLHCPQEALTLVRRVELDPLPVDEHAWQAARNQGIA